MCVFVDAIIVVVVGFFFALKQTKDETVFRKKYQLYIVHFVYFVAYLPYHVAILYS